MQRRHFFAFRDWFSGFSLLLFRQCISDRCAGDRFVSRPMRAAGWPVPGGGEVLGLGAGSEGADQGLNRSQVFWRGVRGVFVLRSRTAAIVLTGR